MSDTEKLIKRKVVNTGHIAFLKAKGYDYEKVKRTTKDGKRVIEFVFSIPEDQISICENYWNKELVSAIDFKRELDTTRQEIEDAKNNWNLKEN